MKVLVVAPYLPFPPDHGGRIRSAVLLRALAAAHDVELLAPLPAARAPAEAWARELGIALVDLPAAPAAGASLLRKLGCWVRGRSELLARRWTPASGEVVRARLAAGGFELLVADSSYVLPLVPDLAPPLLLHLHNVESAMFARADGTPRGPVERWQRRLEATLMAAAEGAAAARAAWTVTVSELDRLRILALAPLANAHAVPNSIDLAALPLLPPRLDGPPRLLFVGSFDYPPNLEAARELVQRHLPALRAPFPGLCVRLVGRDDAGALRPLAAVDGVELVGYAEELLPHYQGSDAVYLPIRAGGGTRIKVLEAFALGRPVLSTAVGVEGLGLVEDRDYLRCETPAQGAAALQRVLAGEAVAMVAAARERVAQRWSHDAAMAQLQQLVATPFAASSAAPSRRAPLQPLARAFGRWLGRPLGALSLLRW